LNYRATRILLGVLLLLVCNTIQAGVILQEDTTNKDSLKYKLKDQKPYEEKPTNLIDFSDPDVLTEKVVYNPENRTYTIQKMAGNIPIGAPRVMSFQEYLKYKAEQDKKDYFKQKSKATNYTRGFGSIPDLFIPDGIVDDIFGGGIIDIRPSGSAELIFGGTYNRVENPNFTARMQRNAQFDFKLNMQVNVTGQIGDRMKINTNYNTEATFEFDNLMKLDWQGKEDDILQGIELGNVSLPLNGSLIQGGSALFGLKTTLQFGALTVTAIASQQRGETRETEVNGGAQITKFNIQASDYDANRHFFLAQHFAENYDNALSKLPLVQSNALITYIEVWVTNRANNFNQTDNLTAAMDLGETKPFNAAWTLPSSTTVPDNQANRLYEGLTRSSDATKAQMKVGEEYIDLTNARQLRQQEFTINERLGYISLNQALNTDEVLAVAYEYTYNGVIYKVGDFVRDRPPEQRTGGTLVVKMLKGNLIKTELPTWDLMMKNIYSLGAYNLQTQDFNFNVVYADDRGAGDINYLPVEASEPNWKDKQLNTVFNLDNLNRLNEAKPDGQFDAIEGITIQSQQGRIIFPMREPFGDFTRNKFQDPDGRTADYYAFDALYDRTKWDAEQDVAHDKFFLRGSYKGSASNQIRLQCFNVTRGAVRVTANGSMLNEGTDYTVDYTVGIVTIINEGILGSGAVIKASCESNSLFNMQQKTLVGSRFDYRVSEKLLLGGTILHLTERPLTPKTNIGEEPLLNTIWGFDGAYETESRFLTKLVDRIPLIETKEISTVNLNWEFAQIIPHKPLSIGDAERGTSFLDDFEGAEIPYDLRVPQRWKMASVPQYQPDLFPLANTPDVGKENDRRALLSWYTIDPILQSDQQFTPDHLRDDPTQRSSHFIRQLTFAEVFPEMNIQQATPRTIPTLDLAYFPNVRGPYNFGVNNLNVDGTLANPSNNWAGISRRIEQTDFEAANIDYIEIWVMDPFVFDKANGVDNNDGYLYINIGSVSEDVLPDGKKSTENALPTATLTSQTDTSDFAVYSDNIPINRSFDNDPSARPNQDVGLDGVNDEGERLDELFGDYVQAVEARYPGSQAAQNANADPAGDNYVFYRDPNYDANETPVISRYKYFQNTDGNSTIDRLDDQTPMSATVLPDDEDINGDNTLDRAEEYYQYKIPISQSELRVGRGYVADAITVDSRDFKVDPGAGPDSVTYYQLKIPVAEYEKAVGGINDFKSIRFMRMFLTGFEDSVVMRFINLQLVRAEWRRYLGDLKYPPTIGLPPDPTDPTEFVISTVNIEENSSRDPIPYVEPPGIARELDPTQPNQVLQNEQSISLYTCGLEKGDARGAFRVTEVDIRNYEFLKMFVHAEEPEGQNQNLQNGDVWAFVRLGTDLENNYYEYQLPLELTQHGARFQEEVWPVANNIELRLQDLYDLKLEREQTTGSRVAEYEKTLPNGAVIRVVGLPDLSQVRSIMLGVLNPDQTDVMDPICAEVWFNELRVTGIANKGGWAATARMVTKLADFANVNVSGNYQTIGFGGIDQTLNERNLEQSFQYDISSNIQLGKFFPQKWGVSIPMFVGWNENIINPKFYPLNPDILYRQVLDAARTPEERRKIRETSQDYTSRYSLNFTNVSKSRAAGSKPRLWDISNFNTSYSFQRLYRRNQIVEENFINTHRASLAYNYSIRGKSFEPFKKSIKNPKLALIRDLNIGYMPNSLNFQFDVDRRYAELLNRSNDDFQGLVNRFYDKTFTMKRIYGFRWNLTRGLKIDYNSAVDAWIEEPIGPLDTEQKIDTVRENFFGLGTMSNFNQTINANYTVPFNKIRALSWISASARYGASYNWTTAPPAFLSVGNTIQNSQNLTVNGSMNFTSLYNKSKFLRKALRPPPKKRPTPKKKEKPKDGDDDDDKKKKKKTEMNPFTKGIISFLLMPKQAQFSLTQNNGTTLPGFSEEVEYLGHNFASRTPNWGFILGLQDPNLRYELASNGFLSNDTLQNNRYMELYSTTLSGKATLEPFRNFRISLDITLRESKTISSNFRFNEVTQRFEDLALQETGQYSISFFSWRTAFDELTQDYNSDAYTTFLNNRRTIAERVQAFEFTEGGNSRFRNDVGTEDDSTNFPIGYSGTQQDVLLYSFLSAYTGQSARDIKLNPFSRIPIPSWRINYNGLKDLFGLDEYFTNISIKHAYNSTLNMNSYFSEVTYGEDQLERGTNLKSELTFQQGVSIIERFTPLLGLDVTLKNGFTASFEYKQDKNITLFMNTFQMIEQRNKEIAIGAGYRIGQIRLPIKYRGKRIYLENDLNFRFDMSIRDGVTVRRDIQLGTNTPQAGSRMVTIRPTVDYKINDALNFRAFYNRNVNEPKTSMSFPTYLTDFGISLRYTMQ
jgi:cell surface protein SprA